MEAGPSSADPKKYINWLDRVPAWKEHKVIRQGLCCYCWAIVSATVSGYLLHLEHNKDFKLSPQEMLDWEIRYNKDLEAKPKDSKGCYTYSTNKGFQYISKHGLSFEDSYPTVGRRQDITGKVPPAEPPRVFIKKHEILTTQEEILDALNIQPIAGAVDAASIKFAKFNGQGIFDEAKSDVENRRISGETCMHAVTIMGVDVENDAYLIRNSYGEKWGNDGYAWVKRHLVSRFSRPLISSIKE